ncbi:MAG: DUF4349 domain-containing protein [Dehalococcoidia bacterium]|nr:DUF4349 domain-containing protein [Dehalococcoidia bacterium]
MKTLLFALLTGSLLLLSLSCSPAAAPRGAVDEMRNAPTQPSPPKTTAVPATASTSEADSRMTVRTADLRLVVENITTAIERAGTTAQTLGGYVVSSRVWREGSVVRGDISIRVPAIKFDSAMKSLTEMATEVLSRNTTSKDVSEEYTDLNAQLDNLKATEAQLRLIMQKADKVEDILSIQRELTRVGNDIERTKGRIQYLEKTSTTSLIQVILEQSSLVVRITADKAVVMTGEGISFNAEAAGGFAPYSYEWNFGDNNRSTSKSVRHAYASAGSYSVSLKVTDDRGNVTTEVKSSQISVRPGWNPGNVVRAAANGFLVFGRVLVNIVIWLFFFSPVWGVVGYFAWYRPWRRRKQKARQVRLS